MEEPRHAGDCFLLCLMFIAGQKSKKSLGKLYVLHEGAALCWLLNLLRVELLQEIIDTIDNYE